MGIVLGPHADADAVSVSLMNTREKQGRNNWFGLGVSEARVYVSLWVRLGISLDPVTLEAVWHASLLGLPVYGILAVFLDCGEDTKVERVLLSFSPVPVLEV